MLIIIYIFLDPGSGASYDVRVFERFLEENSLPQELPNLLCLTSSEVSRKMCVVVILALCQMYKKKWAKWGRYKGTLL